MKIALLLVCCITQTAIGQVPGSRDISFGDNGKVVTSFGLMNARITAIAEQQDHKLVVTGYAQSSGVTKILLARYEQDGKLDRSFGDTGVVFTDLGNYAETYGVVVRPNGKIVVSGMLVLFGNGNGDVVFVQYLPDGTRDTSFGIEGVARVVVDSVNPETARAMVLRPDGSIVAAGFRNFSNGSDIILVQIDSLGKPDGSFGVKGRTITSIASASTEYGFGLTLQPDGNCIVAGSTDHASDTTVCVLARYLPNGSLDQSFGTEGIEQTPFGTYYDAATAVTTNAPGRIIAAGTTYQDGKYDFGIAEYDSAGVLFADFGRKGKVITNLGNYDDIPSAIDIQPDGKILVSGSAGIGPAESVFALVRYKPDGSLDSSFGSNGVVKTDFGNNGDNAFCMKYLRNGKIIVAGKTLIGSLDAFALVQYHSGLATVTHRHSVEAIQVYPNPLSGRLITVKFETQPEAPIIISVSDLIGRIVYSKTCQVHASDRLQLTLPDLSFGYYQMVVQAADATYTVDLIK